ncbi:MAG: hypothetical protein ABI280_10460 [Ginsengibacter sp.]
MSHRRVESGPWEHPPRWAARVGVPTNSQHFERHPDETIFRIPDKKKPFLRQLSLQK